MQISVIIATYNRAKPLELTLAGLSQQTFRDFEVIVADDGGDDDTVHVVDDASFDYQIDMKYVWHTHHGFGLSRTRNDGVKVASGELLHFIDSDILLNPKALENAWNLYQENHDRAIGGYYRYMKAMIITKNDVIDNFDAVWEEQLPVPLDAGELSIGGPDMRELKFNEGKLTVNPFNDEHELFWSPLMLLGGNMIIPRHIFDLTGGFDENFTVYGGEDAEMSLAIISRGYPISYSRGVGGVHMAHRREASSLVGDGGEMAHRRYIAKKYPLFLLPDGMPNLNVWGKPVERRL